METVETLETVETVETVETAKTAYITGIYTVDPTTIETVETVETTTVETVEIYPVSMEDLHEILPAASPHIQRCAAITNGAKTYGGFVKHICSGEWLMWVVYSNHKLAAVAGTTIWRRPDGKLGLDITFLGGDGIATWCEELLTAITKYARENEVFAMVATARPGMKVALPGWKVRAWEFYKECDE